MKKLFFVVFVIYMLLFCACGKNGDNSEKPASQDESFPMPWVDYSDEDPMQGSEECYVIVKKPYSENLNRFDTFYNCVRTNGNTISFYTTDGAVILEKYVGTVYDNGNLREILYYRVINHETGLKDIKLFTKTEYDESGKILKETQYLVKSGEAWNIVEYKYNEKGLLTDIITKYYDKISTKSYTYNDNGNLLTYTYYDSKGKLNESEECIYNDKGILTTKYTYNGKEKDIYDENGKVIEIILIYEDGKERTFKKLQYDENNNIKKCTEYRYDGKVFYTIYTYDDNANLLNITEYDDTDTPSIWIKNEYDENNNLLKTIEYNNNKISGTEEKKYNENDLLIEEISYSSDNTISQRLAYEYDENGNQTKKIEYNRYDEAVTVIDYTWEHVCYPEGFYIFLETVIGDYAVVRPE